MGQDGGRSGARVPTRAAVTVAIGAAIAVAAACGGSSGTDLNTTSSSGGAGGGSSGTSGGSSGTGPTSDAGAPYTLDNVCERTGPIICDLIKACCNAGVGYDEAGCVAHAKADCDKDVAEARAGREEFHAERVDPCLPKYRAVYATCTLTFDLIQGVAKDLAACAIFTGQGVEGTSCKHSSECKAGATDADFVSCSDETHTCHTTHLAAEGEPCSITTNLPTICEKGLYCDVELFGDGGARDGRCKKATPLNASCSKPLECGLGNYCAKTTKNCTPGKGAGAPCEDALECASVTCVKASGAASGTCKALDPLAKPEECKGP